MSGDRPDGLFDALCLYETELRIVLTVSLLLLGLTLVSLAVLEDGTASYAIATINLVTLVVLSIGIGAIVWRCKGR